MIIDGRDLIDPSFQSRNGLIGTFGTDHGIRRDQERFNPATVGFEQDGGYYFKDALFSFNPATVGFELNEIDRLAIIKRSFNPATVGFELWGPGSSCTIMKSFNPATVGFEHGMFEIDLTKLERFQSRNGLIGTK